MDVVLGSSGSSMAKARWSWQRRHFILGRREFEALSEEDWVYPPRRRQYTHPERIKRSHWWVYGVLHPQQHVHGSHRPCSIRPSRRNVHYLFGFHHPTHSWDQKHANYPQRQNAQILDLNDQVYQSVPRQWYHRGEWPSGMQSANKSDSWLLVDDHRPQPREKPWNSKVLHRRSQQLWQIERNSNICANTDHSAVPEEGINSTRPKLQEFG